MAEPARRIYDQDQPEKNIRPDLRAVEGTGGKAPENLREAEEDAGSKGKDAEPTKEGAEDLGSKEQTAAEDSGSFYKKSGKSKAGLRGRLTTRRNVIMGSAAAVVIALIIGFMFILPLKIMHIVTNLQSHFFSTAENAVEKQTDRLFSKYVQKNLLPSLSGTCRSTRVSKSCIAPISGTSPIAKLWDGWRQGNLEGKIAAKYDLEFLKQGDRYYLKTSGLPGNGLDISGFATGDKDLNDFIPASRQEIRRAVRNAVKNESFVIRSMYKYKVMRLLSKKYGVKFCIINCNAQDNFRDKIDNKKRAAKLFLIQRVLKPRAEGLALVMDCVMDPGCKPKVHDPDDFGGFNGEKRTEFQKSLQSRLAIHVASLSPPKSLDDIYKDVEDIHKNGYSRYAIRRIIALTIGKEAANTAVSAIPVIGWATFAGGIVNTLDKD